MPFPPSGPAAWRPEEAQPLWAWSSEPEPGDTRARGQPLSKGMGTGLNPGRRELEGRARLPPWTLGGVDRAARGRCQHRRPWPEGLIPRGACLLGLAAWQALCLFFTLRSPPPSTAQEEGLLGGPTPASAGLNWWQWALMGTGLLACENAVLKPPASGYSASLRCEGLV